MLRTARHEVTVDEAPHRIVTAYSDRDERPARKRPGGSNGRRSTSSEWLVSWMMCESRPGSSASESPLAYRSGGASSGSGCVSSPALHMHADVVVCSISDDEQTAPLLLH
jgi:hypothetical protein